MKNITTLEKVFDRIDRQSAKCYDELIDVKDIEFDKLDTIKIRGGVHPLRSIAQRSIAWRLGIPFNYLQKCPEDLQADQMMHWLQFEKNDQLFVRFDDQDVRAIFTPKYKPVDNFEVLTRLDEMGYSPDTECQCFLDGEFMLLSVMDGKQSFKVNGDKMTPGISVSDSEVGLASLSISAFFLRLVCTNGMVAKTEIAASFRHVSTKILNELPEIFSTVGEELSMQRGKFKLSLESHVDNPSGTIESFNRQFQLKEPEKEAVDWAWPQEAGDTMFNVVNTYTRAAAMEGLPAESSYRLQKVGGNILAMVQ